MSENYSNDSSRLNNESAQYYRAHKTRVVRNFIAILVSAIFVLAFNPHELSEYVATILFVLPILMMAERVPLNIKKRIFSIILLYILCMFVFLYFVDL